ncbi:unnamed protein product, partial [Tetraodon nigroviridis]
VLMFEEVWSRSFCRTIEKLVEVVQEYPTEVEYIYSPSCVPLVRCAGCCGDEKLECHPTTTTNVTMQLLKIRPSEPHKEYVHMTFVEHQTCEYASSEYLSAVDLTDTEDAGRHGTLVPTVQDGAGTQVAMMRDSYPGLSPMIIMNNFVLKQPSLMAPAKKQLGYSSPVDVMPQSQVVFLQPMLSNGNGAGSLKPCSKNVRQSKSYMPILKSYPKIAPHPADATNKKMGSKMRVSSGSGYDQRHRRHRHSSRLSSSLSVVPQTPNKPSCNTQPVGNQSEVAERQESSLSFLTGSEFVPPYADEIRTDGLYDDQDPTMDTNKQKRFSNTYNILNKSGLLGITMRTKQLIKENKRTQGQLQQLREQTGLLLEALSSGEPQLWSKLQLSLQHSDKEQWAAKAQEAMG